MFNTSLLGLGFITDEHIGAKKIPPFNLSTEEIGSGGSSKSGKTTNNENLANAGKNEYLERVASKIIEQIPGPKKPDQKEALVALMLPNEGDINHKLNQRNFVSDILSNNDINLETKAKILRNFSKAVMGAAKFDFKNFDDKFKVEKLDYGVQIIEVKDFQLKRFYENNGFKNFDHEKGLGNFSPSILDKDSDDLGLDLNDKKDLDLFYSYLRPMQYLKDLCDIPEAWEKREVNERGELTFPEEIYQLTTMFLFMREKIMEKSAEKNTYLPDLF